MGAVPKRYHPPRSMDRKLLWLLVCLGCPSSEPDQPRLAVAWTPAALDFGTTLQEGIADRTLTIQNIGADRLVIRSVDLGGASTSFSVVSAVQALEPGAQGSVEIRFRGAPTPDVQQASLTVQSNAENHPTFVVPLSGRTMQSLPDGGIPDGSTADGSTADGGPPDGGASCDGICLGGDWCWDNPRPLGNGITDLWGAGPDDLWGISTEGTIIRFQGKQWENGGAPQDAAGWRAIFGTQQNNVWAVGVGASRWDGQAWVVDPSANGLLINDLWGSSGNALWGTGDPKLSLFDGSSWTAAADPFDPGQHFFAMHGFSENNIWVAGDNGAVARFDGNTWTVLRDGGEAFDDVWGADPQSVWAVGLGRVLHFDGSEWSDRTHPDMIHTRGVWGADAQNVWFADQSGVFHFDGTSITPAVAPTTSGYAAVWGQGPMDVWFSALDGTLVHYDGQFSRHGCGFSARINGLWAFSEDHVWAVGHQGGMPVLGQRRDEAWALTPLPPDVSPGGTTIFGLDENNVYFGGGDRITRYDGTTYHQESPLPGTWRRVWASGPSDVWAAGFDASGRGLIARRNGSRWSTSTVARSGLNDLWGSGPNDIWAAGTQGLMLHYDGSDWVEVPTPARPGQSFSAVWSASPDFAVAAIHLDRLLLWDGVLWRPSTEGQIHQLWGSGPSDVWAVGPGQILRFDGQQWHQLNGSAVPSLLFSVHGFGDRIYAGGHNGILRRER